MAALLHPNTDGHGEALLPDETLIPVQDKHLTRPPKNYSMSVNIQVLATASRRSVRVGDAWPGNRNDITTARATNQLPGAATTLTDAAYRS